MGSTSMAVTAGRAGEGLEEKRIGGKGWEMAGRFRNGRNGPMGFVGFYVFLYN